LNPSGTPVEGVEIVVVDAPEILGVAVPWEEPLRLAAKTDESGRLRFLWSHGNPKRGPLLEVHAPGHALSSTRLGAGYSECEVRLKTLGQTDATSEARCAVRTAAETGR
jgi:hypothetical protein